MVEVFKTNVRESDDAQWLLRQIKNQFNSYTANFDLGDCDHILRIESADATVDVGAVERLISHLGFHAEVLPDDTPAFLVPTSE